MSKKCLKCGYVRVDSDIELAPEYECPKCGIVYSKLERAVGKEREAAKEAHVSDEDKINSIKKRSAEEREDRSFDAQFGEENDESILTRPIGGKANYVCLENEAGMYRSVKVGFSWTVFFFGGFPFFFRGMPLHALAWIVVGVLTLRLSDLVLMFIINKQTAHYYLENGYKPVGKGWDEAKRAWGIRASVIVGEIGE